MSPNPPKGMATADLARLLAVPSLGKRLAAVERRMTDSLKPFKTVLRPEAFQVLTRPAKRVRPILTIACAELGGAFDKRVASAGAAIELVQAGSLIHDDIIEGARTRRGRPTINATEGATVALVVGDLVLAQAAMVASGLGEQPSALLSRSMAEMCAGQLAEMREAFNVARTDEAYLAAVRAKTGALFAAACRVGGICAGMSGRQLDSLTTFGGTFGVMYQAVDDVLDLTGDPARLGKPTGVDLASGVYTAPVIDALRRRGGKVLARLLPGKKPRDLEEATRRVLRSGAIEDTEAAIYALADEASASMRTFADHPTAQGLRRLPRHYVDWAFGELRPKAPERS